jgi:hypothetical protein
MSKGSLFCALTAALCCAACDGDVTGPVKTMAVAWNPSDQAYELSRVRLATTTSLRHLRGGAGTVLGGGAVVAVDSLITAKGATVEQLRRQLVQSASSDVDLSFNLADSVAYPETLDALQLVTAYYNLEQARDSFNTWGLSGLPPATLVLGADVRDDAGHPALARSEMYFQPLAIHYLPTPNATTQIPMAMNLGAMAHSLTHQAAAVFAWGGAPAPSTDQGPSRDADWNIAKHAARSMTEGMADFLAAAVTEDPHWLSHSDQQIADSRALDKLRCSSAEMLSALPLDDGQVPYDPYPLGTVLAAALWEEGRAGQFDVLASGVLASFVKIKAAAAAGGGKLTVADLLDSIVAATSPDEAPGLCGLFLDRFAALTVRTLPSCTGIDAVPPGELCACDPNAGNCP